VRVLLTGRASEGSDRDLSSRLLRAGRPQSPPQYRLERVMWGAGAGIVGLIAGSAFGGAQSPVLVGLLTLLAAVVGWGACDARLRGQARRRGRVIERQLPALADLVALAVSAGATPVVALERAAVTMPGPLSDDVSRAVREVHSGVAVDLALQDLAAVSGVPSVGRFVDALIVALQRGTPLADVVRAQAADVRADERRRLMETAGRKDVSMLVPIVFLVLPTVVVIALFPGVQALHLVVP
jgi:tight adherence protein C